MTFFDIKTQNAIWACAKEAENEINNAKISEFLKISCEDSHLMHFIFEGNPIHANMVKEPGNGQMIGGNDDVFYTVTSEVTKENKKYR